MQFPTEFQNGRFLTTSVFADSGGMGLILDARDTICANNRILLKTTRYDSGANAKHFKYTAQEAVDFVEKTRAILEWEKKVLVRFRNEGLNNIPSPLHFFYGPSVTLREKYNGKNGSIKLPKTLLDTEPYLAMELIPGDILEDRMKTADFRKNLEVHLLSLAREILTVFIRLHKPTQIGNRNGYFIYQDLKPANIIVSGDSYFTLIDFGAVTLKLGDKTTEPTAGCITVGYAAPESEGGNEAYIDHRFDLYTLGATLWHAVTLSDPRELPPGKPLDLQSARSKGLSPAFLNIMNRALARDPNQRYQTAGEMRKDVMITLRDALYR